MAPSSFGRVLRGLALGLCGALACTATPGDAPQDEGDEGDESDESELATSTEASSPETEDSETGDSETEAETGTQPTPLPACEGDLWAPFELDAIDSPDPDSDMHMPPDAAAREALGQALSATWAASGGEDWADALAAVEAAEYELCGDENLLRLMPVAADAGHARVMLRPEADADAWIVGAPHVYFDSKTLPEARVIFERTQARMLIVSGLHRCAETTPSPCDGTSSVCGQADAPFRRSDMAHTEESYFHAAHLAAIDGWPEARVLSVHGMSDAGISLSDGSDDPSDADALVARLATALAASFPSEMVTTCNDYPGATLRVLKCGTTNTQGRAVNGSPDACDLNPSATNGRFIHLEQSSEIRDMPELVADAIASL